MQLSSSLIVNIITYVVGWYSCSTALSVLNKELVSFYKFPPLFSTAYQSLCHFLFSWLVLNVFRLVKAPSRPPISWKTWSIAIFPAAFCTAVDISVSVNSLAFITLSFYTMIKSLTPIFVLTFAFLLGLEKPSAVLILTICIIVSGAVLCVEGEVQFHLLGFLMALSASVLSGFRWSVTQLLLQKAEWGVDNPVLYMYQLSPVLCASQTIGVLLFERSQTSAFFAEHFATYDSSLKALGLLTSVGLLAFCMMIFEFSLVSVTSVITLSVFGMLKEILTIGVSVAIFHDKLTTKGILGLIITLIGIGLYNYQRYRRNKLYTKLSTSEKAEEGRVD